jgi:hypothetical protein
MQGALSLPVFQHTRRREQPGTQIRACSRAVFFNSTWAGSHLSGLGRKYVWKVKGSIIRSAFGSSLFETERSEYISKDFLPCCHDDFEDIHQTGIV